jgi:hypothetical protein
MMDKDSLSTWSLILKTAQWALAPVSAVIAWFARGWAIRRSKERRREQILALLNGLPPETKAVLVHFYEHGTHTMRGNPGERIIEMLINARILRQGVGGGTYAAIDCYLTVRPEGWKFLELWADSKNLTSAS